MGNRWTRTALTLRIDRCYLVAAWTDVAAKRQHYMGMARAYRHLLGRLTAEARQPVAA